MRVAGGRLHPAVGREDPERRHERAGGDHQRGEEVQPLADALHAEQHDAQEAGLEEEGRQHLVAHQGPEDGAGLVGEHAPVGAELVAHDDARHDAHAEADGEDLLPVVEEGEEDVAAGAQPQAFEHGEIAGEADGEGGKDDVEGDREGELQPGEGEGVELHGFGLLVGLTVPVIPASGIRPRAGTQGHNSTLASRLLGPGYAHARVPG